MTRLNDLPYVDKLGGIVQTIKRTTKDKEGNSIIYNIPVARNFRIYKKEKDEDGDKILQMLSCYRNAKIEDFVPESKLSGMIYFEDEGTTLDESKRHSAIKFWNSRLRLVGWFNQKKFRNEFDNNFRIEAIQEIINTITMKRPVQKVGDIFHFFVEVDSIPSLDASIFSQFDYNEAQTQFLTPPYDFFAIDLNISFGTARNCLINFIPEETTC